MHVFQKWLLSASLAGPHPYKAIADHSHSQMTRSIRVDHHTSGLLPELGPLPTIKGTQAATLLTLCLLPWVRSLSFSFADFETTHDNVFQAEDGIKPNSPFPRRRCLVLPSLNCLR